MWTDILYASSIMLFLIASFIYLVFRKDTVDEAKRRVTGWWPARFLAYRSGHGKHALA